MLFFAKCWAWNSDLIVTGYVVAEPINNNGILDRLLTCCLALTGLLAERRVTYPLPTGSGHSLKVGFGRGASNASLTVC
jgi:hypothetical protein